jgi:hypothetical protein
MWALVIMIRCKTLIPLYLFIGAIGAILFAVAAPLRCNAILFRALKLFDWVALCGSTFGFIRSVTAVVVTITYPATLDTSAVVTGELIGATSIV